MDSKRAYTSPLREQKARQTHEAILQALFDLMQTADAPEDIGMDQIGKRAGVQKRTIFRHFESKERLYAEFWQWLNARIGVSPTPQSLPEIIDGPRNAFPRFDEFEAVMRVMIHSRAGREMRANTIHTRRALFDAALGPTLEQLSGEDSNRIKALAHLLYSASAWENFKDYSGLDGAQAGETASWALEVILSAVTNGEVLADKTSQEKETRDDP